MVNAALIGRVLGMLMLATGCAMVLPLLVSLGYGEEDWTLFLISAALAITAGGGLQVALRSRTSELMVRDGFVIVTVGWMVVGLIGALPFWLSGAIPSFTDAYFESVSGFTTTGASVLRDIEGLGHGVALWRCQIQWLGGMGIVVLSLAILPLLGVGGMQLFKAEAPGPTPDRLTPRIKETARLLWVVYLAISVVEFVVLNLAGMGPFDAACHTFATMATGGFSPKAASIAAYDSALIDGIITAFMFLAGVNFALHFAALRGSLRSYWRDGEFRVYLGVILVAGLAIGAANAAHMGYDLVENLRYTSFTVVSIITTTGFGTADYEQWNSLAQVLLLGLMFIGGCAGSTGGGMKNVRLYILVHHAFNELRKLLHPRGVYVIRYNGAPVPGEIVTNILGFFLLLMLVTVTGTVVMCAFGMDLLSAFGAVAATLNNIGPGVGSVGPTDNFAHVPDAGKWALVFFMLLGRLELFTVLVLLTPDFWRRA